MATDGNIDFRSHSREDLVNAVQQIDRERFPLNFAAATAELASRGPDVATAIAAATKPLEVNRAIKASWAAVSFGAAAALLFGFAHAVSIGLGLLIVYWSVGLLMTWWVLDEIGNGKNWARLLAVFSAPYYALRYTVALLAFHEYSPLGTVAGATSLALSIWSAYLLLSQPSRRWFADVKRRSVIGA